MHIKPNKNDKINKNIHRIIYNYKYTVIISGLYDRVFLTELRNKNIIEDNKNPLFCKYSRYS